MNESSLAFAASRDRYEAALEQWRKTIERTMSPEDLRTRAEILFSCHSCAIEGNSYSEEDTRALKELSLSFVPQGKTLVETMEMLDHLHTYEYMTAHLDATLDEAFLKHLHFLLTEHTLAYLHEGAKPGEYTDTDMCAGATIFGDHEELVARVPDLLNSTEKALARGLPPMEVAARFHGFFEHLHPFRDGNGRLGRLLVNFILLRTGLPVLIIPIEKRAAYIDCLRLFRSESQEFLIDFFYQNAAERMETEMKEKKKASRPMMFLF